jgi:anaerobic magnesium-protoporphyrin IX monomethyl ester cyclase
MKVMLLFPPPWIPAMPHLALPALTAYLRAHAVEVIQRDLNIEVFDALLTHDYLKQTVTRLCQNYGPQAKRLPGRHGMPSRERLQWALDHGPILGDQIQDAMNVLRSDAFLDGPVGVQAFFTIVQSLDIASLPFYPSSLTLSGYTPPYSVDSSPNLLRLARDPQYNVFLDLFRHMVIPDIEREQPDIVGISIPTMDQMLAGMTLAHLIKDAGLPCHVTVGGPHISMLREQLPRLPALFNLFDSAILFDGEVPLLRLAEALDTGRELAHVPNLIYYDGSRVRVADCLPPAKITPLPVPDFDGLPLGRYLAPSLVLPLQTSRGCYHGKCAFCNVGYGAPSPYRPLPGERVVEHMLALKEKYGARHIFFADEAISPRTLRDMSEALEGLGSPPHWCGCVRFEAALTPELLERMARAGCCMLLFGLESASRSTMRNMAKGTQLDTVRRVLNDSAQAGIWNHTFFFFGFPGETIDHAQETVNFVYQQQRTIHSASPGAFVLERDAPVHHSPEKYGIRRIRQDPDKDLAIYFDYEVEDGMDQAMADLVVSHFVDSLPEKRFGQYYVNDAYRFLYASHLRGQGIPFPSWLVADEVTIGAP